MISGAIQTVDLEGLDPDPDLGRGQDPNQANLARLECQVDVTEGQKKWTRCTAGSAEVDPNVGVGALYHGSTGMIRIVHNLCTCKK